MKVTLNGTAAFSMELDIPDEDLLEMSVTQWVAKYIKERDIEKEDIVEILDREVEVE